MCIRDRLYSAVEGAMRKKHQPLNTYVSFAEQEWEEGDSRQNAQNPETIVIGQERAADIEKKIGQILSPFRCV